MREDMGCAMAPQASTSLFALVSYIPEPLGVFLDDLRLELQPDCSPHAHVTILPPRPIGVDSDAAARDLRVRSARFAEFEVELDAVEIFPISKVIYIGLKRGERELRSMYASLNSGPVQFCEPFPYHPHVTLAQNFEPQQLDRLHSIAKRRWSEYDGSRSFSVDCLDFVKNIAGNCWKDLASIALTQRAAA